MTITTDTISAVLDTTTTTITLERADAKQFVSAVRAASIVRSKDATRPAIHALLLENTPDDGARLVATDSYRLVIVPVSLPSLPVGEWMLDGDLVAGLVKATPATVRPYITSLALNFNDRGTLASVTLTAGDGTATSWTNREVGQFPNYRAVTRETGVTGEVVGFRPAYLADLNAIAREFGAKQDGDACVRLTSSSADGPAVFSLAVGLNNVATYWVMPTR